MVRQAVGAQMLPERTGRAERDAAGGRGKGKEVFPSLDLMLAVTTASSPCLRSPVHDGLCMLLFL